VRRTNYFEIFVCFPLQLDNGLKVTAYYRKKTRGKKDVELVGLAKYLEKLAAEVDDFTKVKFRHWMDVLSGRKKLLEDEENTSSA